ncbi:TonB-dependent receptor [Hymenobacter ginsengisoli]|uniref:TonB-dependent receptor n=1 Tax=Hymenobacter ginsengisoli TaxID=1051626 RepID=A0ABP8QRU6_9BACT|nr:MULTISPECIES: TonB-dependent receptor [unclassified Hymenobacter]MBO2032230.1 TonB-dependent receptor [Hymenobacter sp. BT559]
MLKHLLPLSAIVVVMGARDVHAQTRAVSGTVKGADGAAIPGATVLVKGTSLGTSTNADGRFDIQVPASATALVVSYVGYESKQVAIGDQSTVNVTLAATQTGLNEVVVVGYGIAQARRELTGTIATVGGKEIANLPVQSFDQALQGRAAGTNITTPNGVLNNPPVIRIRGLGSLNLSSQPLVVIDGIPTFTGNNSAVGSVPNNPLASIDPNDIENVEVLKDAASTAIYGSRGSNGVIVVTTKKGKAGQSHLNYSFWAGLTQPVRLFNMLGAGDYVAIKNEAVNNLFANRGLPAPTTPYFKLATDANGNPIDTHWYDYIYRNGVSTNHSLDFSGGNDKTTYYASINYSNQRGMLKKNEFQRYVGRMNIDHKVFSRLTVGARFSYSFTHNLSPNSGSISGGAFGTAGLGRLPLVLPPNVGPYNADGTYNTSGAGIGPGPNLNPNNGAPLLPGYYNPVVDLDNNYFTSDASQVQGSVYADAEPLTGLHLRSNFGINNISFEDKAFYTALAGDGYSSKGEADNYYRTNKLSDWQNTASYAHTFAEKHNLSIVLGNEQQFVQQQRWGASRTNIADPFFTTFQGNFTNIAASGNFAGQNYLVSFFSRLDYNFNRKYLISLNARRDGYSAWAQKWGNFFGGSAGYIISEEDFWKNSGINNTLNFLKVSASTGTVGNNQGIDDFASLQLYGSGLYAANPTLYYSQAASPSLTWEKARKTDISLNMGFLQDRLTVEATYYRNLINGLILPVPAAASLGIPGGGPGGYSLTIPANVGSMLNQGVEASVRFNAIRNKPFTWTVNANLTTLKNEVLTLADGLAYVPGATSGLETVNYTTAGRSVGSILAVPSVGVNPENGRRMIQKADGTVVQYQHLAATPWTTLDGKAATAPSQLVDGRYYGPVLPTFYGGLDNTFTFKGFDLGVFIQYSGGNYIYNGTKAGLHDQRFWNNAADIKDHWTPTNHNVQYPAVVYGDNVSNGSALVMSSNIEKGDFVRLRNVSLGYTFKSEMLSSVKLASARIYVQAQNLVLLTRYTGSDPEISTNGAQNTAPGVDRNSVGQARTYTAGVIVGF